VTDLAAPSANAIVPGVLGFIVVAAMAVALFFLLRSMNKQLRKVGVGPRWRGQGRDVPSGAARAASSADPGGGPNGSALTRGQDASESP
jgi:hypothetical protein